MSKPTRTTRLCTPECECIQHTPHVHIPVQHSELGVPRPPEWGVDQFPLEKNTRVLSKVCMVKARPATNLGEKLGKYFYDTQHAD